MPYPCITQGDKISVPSQGEPVTLLWILSSEFLMLTLLSPSIALLYLPYSSGVLGFHNSCACVCIMLSYLKDFPSI